MVIYDIRHGESLGAHGVANIMRTKKSRVVKDMMIMLSGCSEQDIEGWDCQSNIWFGDYYITIEKTGGK